MSGQIGEPEYFSYLPVEMLDHALIEPGPVSVVASVHLVVVVGMGELKQSAATGLTRALDELQRPFGHSLLPGRWEDPRERDRKSTRLNSSHITISYAVFCLKKKK